MKHPVEVRHTLPGLALPRIGHCWLRRSRGRKLRNRHDWRLGATQIVSNRRSPWIVSPTYAWALRGATQPTYCRGTKFAHPAAKTPAAIVYDRLRNGQELCSWRAAAPTLRRRSPSASRKELPRNFYRHGTPTASVCKRRWPLWTIMCGHCARIRIATGDRNANVEVIQDMLRH